MCRHCGGAYESRHMIRVLGKSGIEKNLPAKIHHVCGITISERLIAFQSWSAGSAKNLSSTSATSNKRVQIFKVNLYWNKTVQ